MNETQTLINSRVRKGQSKARKLGNNKINKARNAKRMSAEVLKQL